MYPDTRYPMISKTESGRVGYQKKYRVAGRVRVPAGHWVEIGCQSLSMSFKMPPILPLGELIVRRILPRAEWLPDVCFPKITFSSGYHIYTLFHICLSILLQKTICFIAVEKILNSKKYISQNNKNYLLTYGISLAHFAGLLFHPHAFC